MIALSSGFEGLLLSVVGGLERIIARLDRYATGYLLTWTGRVEHAHQDRGNAAVLDLSLPDTSDARI